MLSAAIDQELFEEINGNNHAPVDYESDSATEFHRTWRSLSERELGTHLEDKWLVINGEGGGFQTGHRGHKVTLPPPDGWTWPELIMALYARMGCQSRTEFILRIRVTFTTFYDWMSGKYAPGLQASSRLLSYARECGLIEEAA